MRRLRSLALSLVLAAGFAFGVSLALPLPDIAGKCPPKGEGLMQCVVNLQVLPSVLRVLIGMAAAMLVYELACGAPGLYRRWRAGEFRRIVGANPPWQQDPILVASVWGATYDDPKAARGGLHRTRVARTVRERLADAHAAPPRTPASAPAGSRQPASAATGRDARVAALALTIEALEKLSAPRSVERSGHDEVHELPGHHDRLSHLAAR